MTTHKENEKQECFQPLVFFRCQMRDTKQEKEEERKEEEEDRQEVEAKQFSIQISTDKDQSHILYLF